MYRILLTAPAIFTVPPRGYGGAEVQVYYLAGALARLGHAVTVACPRGSELPPGVDAIMPVEPDGSNPEHELYGAYRDRAADFDVILDHGWLGYPYMLEVEGRPHPPVIHTCYSLGLWNTMPTPHPCLVACSQWHARHLEALTGNPVRSVYLAVDPDHYQLAPQKPREHLLLLQRLSPYKGAREFVAVCHALNLPGKLVVEDKFVEDFEFVVDIMGMCDGRELEYLGPLPNLGLDKLDYLQRALALVHPVHETYCEGFGILYPEAMCCGTPVLTTDQGAAREVLMDLGLDTDGGRVFNNLQELIVFAASGGLAQFDPQAVRRRGEWFSPARMALGYLGLIDEVVHGRIW